MKHISVRTQIKLMFIPYANVLNFLIWYNNYWYLNLPMKMGFQSFLLVVASAFMIVIPLWVFPDFFAAHEWLKNILMVYVLPLLMSANLIWYQKKNDLDF